LTQLLRNTCFLRILTHCTRWMQYFWKYQFSFCAPRADDLPWCNKMAFGQNDEKYF